MTFGKTLMNTLLLDSTIRQLFNGIRVTGVRCGSVVVSFDLDLINTEIVSSSFGIPIYNPNTRVWSVTMDILHTTLMGLFNRSSINADPTSLSLKECPPLTCECLTSQYGIDRIGCRTCPCVNACENFNCEQGYHCEVGSTGEAVCAPDGLQCLEGAIKCIEKGGTKEICVLREFICDEDDDCEDGRDEANCTVTNVCPGGSRRCVDGEKCVLTNRWCDGSVDCGDGSDEQGCPSTTKSPSPPTTKSPSPPTSTKSTSPPTTKSPSPPTTKSPTPSTTRKETTTAARTCPPLSCLCPISGHRTDSNGCRICPCVNACENVECAKDYHCEVRVGSGEAVCTPDGLQCLEGAIKCIEKGGTKEICVLREFICDEDDDCEDGRDEANCTVTNVCPGGSRRCVDGEKCVLTNRWCDGSVDCGDGSDEQGCPSTTKSPSPPTTTKSPSPPTTTKSQSPPTTTKSSSPPTSTKSPSPPTTKSPSPPTSTKSPSPPTTTKSSSPLTSTKSPTPSTTRKETTTAETPVVVQGVVVLNETWSDDLYNTSSPEYQQLEVMIISQFRDALLSSDLGPFLKGIRVTGMSPGSIIINVEFLFGPGVAIIEEGDTPPENATTVVTVTQIKDILRQKQAEGSFPSNIDVDAINFVMDDEPRTTTTTVRTTTTAPACPSVSGCQLSCPYGLKKNADECQICECWQPCQCDTNKVCVVNYSNMTARCQTEKAGYCPSSKSIGGTCNRECRYDASCSGQQKCCSGNCGTVCIEPLDWPARNLTDCEMRLSETADRLARMPAAPLSVPRCDLKSGNWSEIQCHDSLGMCFCVDSKGMKLKGSDIRGTPDCSTAPDPNAQVRVCPAGVSIHQCDPGLCLRTLCPSHPQAVCRINPCGGCSAQFFDANNNVVSCDDTGLSACERKRKQLLEALHPSDWSNSVREIQHRIRRHLLHQSPFSLLPSESFMVSKMVGDYPVDFCGWPFMKGASGNRRWYFNKALDVCTEDVWNGRNNLNVFTSAAECTRQCMESSIASPSFRGSAIPDCMNDATFNFKQCHAGSCWCVNSQGAAVPGTLTRGGLTCNAAGKTKCSLWTEDIFFSQKKKWHTIRLKFFFTM
ncbi:uncharacterized protein LOC135467138 [Liolophura sinensis]|uniref:uncharacterized protein LOC135467138 n=1 Tax=Liolophura sinensis TaxID=3198878 RepID=UPI003158FB11